MTDDSKSTLFSRRVRASVTRRRRAGHRALVSSSGLYASFATPPPKSRHKGTRRPISAISEGTWAEPEEEAEVSAVLARLKRGMGDHYERIAALGRGGTADVHLVVDQHLGRKAALKVVREDLAHDAGIVRGFVREARINSQLEHPYIVPVHAMGLQDDDRVFITMKYVSGQPLDRVIAELPDGPVPRQSLIELIEVVLKVCDALSFAHDNGIIHRDVKPANVMVGEYGSVYLLDWGLSGRVPKPGTAERQKGALIGTPAYMAPEQATGDHARTGPWTDVFGLGATLYQIVTRRPPYASTSFARTVLDSSVGRFPRASELAGAWLPRELARIIDHAMAVDPQDRFQSVAELREQLVKFRNGDWAFPRREYPAGATIVEAGHPGDEAFFIEQGRCAVYLEPHPEVVVRTMGPGEVFGETAIFAGTPRTATVVALEPTTVVVVDRRLFDEALQTVGPYLSEFIRTLARRFSETR